MAAVRTLQRDLPLHFSYLCLFCDRRALSFDSKTNSVLDASRIYQLGPENSSSTDTCYAKSRLRSRGKLGSCCKAVSQEAPAVDRLLDSLRPGPESLRQVSPSFAARSDLGTCVTPRLNASASTSAFKTRFFALHRHGLSAMIAARYRPVKGGPVRVFCTVNATAFLRDQKLLSARHLLKLGCVCLSRCPHGAASH